MIMTLSSSGVSTRPADRRARSSAAQSWWTPLWLQRKREDHELARWATELRWQWSDTANGAHLAHHTRTAGGMFHVVAPPVHSIDPGPPVTLLVQMLPGQLVDDFQERAHRIAEGMGVPMADITPYGPGLIKVVLLDN